MSLKRTNKGVLVLDDLNGTVLARIYIKDGKKGVFINRNGKYGFIEYNNKDYECEWL